LSTDRKDHDKKVQLLTFWLSELARFFNQPCNRCHVSFSLGVAGSEPRDGTTCLKQKTHAFRVPMPEQEGVIPIVTSCDKWPVIHLVSGWWFEPLWKIWKSGGMIIPNIWKVIKFMFQTTSKVLFASCEELHLLSFHLAAVHFSPSAATWMFRNWLPVAPMQVASSGMQMK
jgi:hypothetical protein